MIAGTFMPGGRVLPSGQQRSDVLDHTTKTLCRWMSVTNLVAVMQALQTFTLLAGTPFSAYMSA